MGNCRLSQMPSVVYKGYKAPAPGCRVKEFNPTPLELRGRITHLQVLTSVMRKWHVAFTEMEKLLQQQNMKKKTLCISILISEEMSANIWIQRHYKVPVFQGSWVTDKVIRVKMLVIDWYMCGILFIYVKHIWPYRNRLWSCFVSFTAGVVTAFCLCRAGLLSGAPFGNNLAQTVWQAMKGWLRLVFCTLLRRSLSLCGPLMRPDLFKVFCSDVANQTSSGFPGPEFPACLPVAGSVLWRKLCSLPPTGMECVKMSNYSVSPEKKNGLYLKNSIHATATEHNESALCQLSAGKSDISTRQFLIAWYMIFNISKYINM